MNKDPATDTNDDASVQDWSNRDGYISDVQIMLSQMEANPDREACKCRDIIERSMERLCELASKPPSEAEAITDGFVTHARYLVKELRL